MQTHATSVPSRSGDSSHAFGYAIAALVGALAGMLFASPKGREVASDMGRRAKTFAGHYRHNRDELGKTVQAIFGEVTDDLTHVYTNVRDAVRDGSDQMQHDAKLTKEKYEQLVKDAIARFTEEDALPPVSSRRLAKHFEDEWEQMKRE